MKRLVYSALAALLVVLPVQTAGAECPSENLKFLKADLKAAAEFLRESEQNNEKQLPEHCQTLSSEEARALMVFPEVYAFSFVLLKGVTGRGFTFLPREDEEGKKWRLAWYEEYSHGGPALAVGFTKNYCLKAIWRREERNDEAKHKYIHDGDIYLTDEIELALLFKLRVPIDDRNRDLYCSGRGVSFTLGTLPEPEYRMLCDFDEEGFAWVEEEEATQLIADLTKAVDKYGLKTKPCANGTSEAVQ